MFDGDIMIPLDIMLKEKWANKIVKILHTIVWIVLCMLVTSDLIEWANNTSLGFPTVRVTLNTTEVRDNTINKQRVSINFLMVCKRISLFCILWFILLFSVY